jgi:hypothetical protein
VSVKESLLKRLAQCVGLASLILVMNYGDLLGGGYDVRMHVPFALNGIVYAQLADILLLGLLLFAVIAPLSRTRAYPWLKLFLAIVVPPYLIERVRPELPFHLHDAEIILFALVWAAAILICRLRSPSRYQQLMRIGDFVGTFLAIFAFFSIAELLYITRWRPGPYEHTASWSTGAQPPREHPLLVWVVFDELAYDQVYGPARSVALPNFDALRNESTVFTDAQPIGDKTVKVLPSLLSGHLINDYRFSFNNVLKVHDIGESGFHELDGTETVFADARQQGWRTATVGWYNPYCTLYAGSIEDCYWMNLDMTDGPMQQQKSFWSNTYTPLRQAAEQIVAPAKAKEDLCTYEVQQRTKTYIDLERHVSQLLHTDQADFIFVHLPVPHSPNIWSRASGSFSERCGNSYLDNLSLADLELGKVMTTLKSSPRWKDTTLIVEGDHSWRTYLWDDQWAWTKEDAAASRAGFDGRPAIIIHHAGQTQPRRDATAWSLLNVHLVVEQVLHGEAMQTAAQYLK